MLSKLAIIFLGPLLIVLNKHWLYVDRNAQRYLLAKTAASTTAGPGTRL